MVGAEVSPLRVLGAACLELDLQTKHKFKVRFVIADVLSVEGILGLDFLSVNKCIIHLEKRQLEVDEKWLNMVPKAEDVPAGNDDIQDPASTVTIANHNHVHKQQ